MRAGRLYARSDRTLAAPADTPDHAESHDSPAEVAATFRKLAHSLDDREAILRARESAVAERSSLIAMRARELAEFESQVAAREDVVRQREARIAAASDRLRADADGLELRFGRFAEARQVLDRAADLDRFELDLVARELAVEVRESAWWSQVTGHETDVPDTGDPRGT